MSKITLKEAKNPRFCGVGIGRKYHDKGQLETHE